ncbi:hypothetical protein ACFWOG_03510 [Kitasatospora sp. NPDC058406]|uniref:hypothetical protein n=1 Tax=Kitasatospora sp. NPDC058406 TaxID=3346483 RepID=UPI0036660F39
MTNDGVAGARSRLGRLIDPNARAADVGDHLDITAEDRADRVRSRLDAMFRDRPELSAVMIRLDGRDVGIATAYRIRSTAGTAAEQPDFGTSDRASLPVLSQQFRVIRFVCRIGSCSGAAVRSYYDHRTVPVCTTAQHGRLELQR